MELDSDLHFRIVRRAILTLAGVSVLSGLRIWNIIYLWNLLPHPWLRDRQYLNLDKEVVKLDSQQTNQDPHSQLLK